MERSSSPLSPPKRKHGELSIADAPPPPFLGTPHFSFEPVVVGFSPGLDDGGSSPRTKVAHKFGRLALEVEGEGEGDAGCGCGVADDGRSHHDLESGDNDVGDYMVTRKRVKLPIPAPGADAPGRTASTGFGDGDGTGDGTNSSSTIADIESTTVFEGPKGEWATGLQATPVVDYDIVRTAMGRPAAGKQLQSHEAQRFHSLSANRPLLPLSESKPRRKRAGTPPLLGLSAAAAAAAAGTDADVVDPVRAALTWREDEITIYDPNDEDDDGTGINGIGFRPTAAVAHARTVNRRQQLAAYKKREDSEARAKRRQRRKGGTDQDDQQLQLQQQLPPQQDQLQQEGRQDQLQHEQPALTLDLARVASPSARRVRFIETEQMTIITT